MARQKRSARTQRQVAAAAMRLFAEKGFSRVTMQEIADAAGIGKGTLYYHTPSKEELGILVLETTARSLLEETRGVAETGGNVTERLAGSLEVLIDCLSAGRELLEIVIPEMSGHDKKTSRRIQKIRLAYLEILEALLAEGIASGEIRPDLDPPVVSRAMMGMIVGFHIHTTHFREGLSSQDAKPQLLQILLAGILEEGGRR